MRSQYRGTGALAGPDEADRAAPGDLAAPAGGRASPRELTDAEIIEGSLREPGRFGLIFARHSEAILRYAHSRLGADLAEDVLAETFLAAFRQRGSYDLSRPDARPWLYGIAIHRIGRHRRADLRRRRALARIPADADTGDFADQSADRVTAQALGPRLAAMLSGLPRADRELLLVIAWGGLSYEEAAQALGLTVSSVRSRLHRIRLKTRRALGGANPVRALPEEAGRG